MQNSYLNRTKKLNTNQLGLLNHLEK